VALKTRDGRYWQTHFLFTTNDFRSYTDYLLAETPGYDPDDDVSPYIGDYMDLLASNKTFYGVFSAYNEPNLRNFPFGVTYKRRVDFTNQLLCPCSGGNSVAPSIDPFFYTITIP